MADSTSPSPCKVSLKGALRRFLVGRPAVWREFEDKVFALRFAANTQLSHSHAHAHIQITTHMQEKHYSYLPRLPPPLASPLPLPLAFAFALAASTWAVTSFFLGTGERVWAEYNLAVWQRQIHAPVTRSHKAEGLVCAPMVQCHPISSPSFPSISIHPSIHTYKISDHPIPSIHWLTWITAPYTTLDHLVVIITR